MITLVTYHRIAGLAVTWLICLGATTAPPASIYLRLPQVQQSPAVHDFTYDAIATVPAVPGTPASLLPPDRVEGVLVIPASATLPIQPGRSWTSLVIVETDENGTVIRRTTFHHVSIKELNSTQKAEGSSLERVRFRAASVDVTPGEVVAKSR
jgi:hypothetical protein